MHPRSLPVSPCGARRRALRTTLPLLLAALPASAQNSSPSDADLARYHDRNRLVLVFASDAKDAHYRQQIAAFQGKASGFKARDLIRFDLFSRGGSKREGAILSDSEAGALRRRFAVAKAQFKILLVGKDGQTAFRSEQPITASKLFGLIDAMPMRQDEMRQHKAVGTNAAPKVVAKGAAPPNRPDKSLKPEQVVKIQMEALQHNDVPRPDSGIATTFAFASPSNKQVTGPLEHFIGIVKTPAYLPMLNCKSVTYDPVYIDGDQAKQRVHIEAADGSHIAYVFLLSRQTDGPFAGCWMNDGCIRDEPGPPGVRDDT